MTEETETAAAYHYKMISVIECSSDYLPEATEHLQKVMDDLRSALASVGAYFGVYLVGRHAGCLGLVHLYRELNDIEPAFGLYAASPHFGEMMQSEQATLRERNLIRLSDSTLPADSSPPEVEVLSRYSAPGFSSVALTGLTSGLSASGMTSIRHGVFWTGANVGHHVLTTGFQSLASAVQSESDLTGNPEFRKALAGARLEERDIVDIRG